MNLLCRDKNHCSHTVAALFMHLKIFKIGLTVLFTYLHSKFEWDNRIYVGPRRVTTKK